MKHGTTPTERITKNTANGSLSIESYEIAFRDVTGEHGPLFRGDMKNTAGDFPGWIHKSGRYWSESPTVA